MRAGAALAAAGAALAVLATGLAPVAAFPSPIPPAPAIAANAFANPHELAFSAAERLVAHSLAREQADSASLFTRDQMIAVLLWLHRAATLRADPAAYLDAARGLWDAAEVAYDDAAQFYDVTLTSDSICVQLEAQAWALLASHTLANATGDVGLRARADAVAGTLASAVGSGNAHGVERCPVGADLPPSQWALPLWALLEYASAAGSAGARDTALARLRTEVSQRFDDAFRDPAGLYLVQVNAQYLLAVQAAARLGAADEFAATRERLAAFLVQRAVTPAGTDRFAYNLQRDGGGLVRVGNPDAAGQLWLALALHNERALRPGSVAADLPEALLDALRHRHWSPQEGGFVGDGPMPPFALNALAALFTTGPAVAASNPERPRIAVAVPAVPDFPYPALDAAGADNYYLSNEWTIRFTLDPVGPSPQRILLPLSRLGPVNLGLPTSRYAPAPTLFQGGTLHPAQAEGAQYPLLDFVAGLDADPRVFRLVAYAPVVPDVAHVQRDARLQLRLNGTEPLTLASLRVDLAVHGVQVQGLAFDDQPLPPAAYAVSDVGETEFLPRPHLRVEVRDLPLAPGARNELVITYADPVAPTVAGLTLTLDPEGRTPLPFENGKYRTGPRGVGFVRVQAADNAALRSVTLAAGAGLNTSETRMGPYAAEPGAWFAPLPPLSKKGPTPMRIRAVDEHDNLNQTPEFLVQPQSTLLQEGNLVLLVFSATLFFTAAVIFVKMGRRRIP